MKTKKPKEAKGGWTIITILAFILLALFLLETFFEATGVRELQRQCKEADLIYSDAGMLTRIITRTEGNDVYCKVYRYDNEKQDFRNMWVKIE